MIVMLRRAEVQRRTGLSRTTIYRMIGEGTFPRPVKLGKRSVGWREAEIEDWLKTRMTTSRAIDAVMAAWPETNLRIN